MPRRDATRDEGVAGAVSVSLQVIHHRPTLADPKRDSRSINGSFTINAHHLCGRQLVSATRLRLWRNHRRACPVTPDLGLQNLVATLKSELERVR